MGLSYYEIVDVVVGDYIGFDFVVVKAGVSVPGDCGRRGVCERTALPLVSFQRIDSPNCLFPGIMPHAGRVEGRCRLCGGRGKSEHP